MVRLEQRCSVELDRGFTNSIDNRTRLYMTWNVAEIIQIDSREYEFIASAIGSMGLVYLPTFTMKLNHSCR